MTDNRDNNQYPASQKTKLLWGTLLFSFVFTALLFSLSGIQIQEWRLFDFWTRNAHPEGISEQVAVVGIDKALLEQKNADGSSTFEWPLEKNVYAEFVMALQAHGAEVITFDFLFLNKTSDDELFSLVLESAAADSAFDVLLGYSFITKESSGQYGVLPKKERNLLSPFSYGEGRVQFQNTSVKQAQIPYGSLLSSMEGGGFVNRPLPMIDGVDRKMLLHLSANKKLYPSLALQSVASLENASIKFDEVSNTVSVGELSCELSKEHAFILNFKDSIPFYPMSQIYRNYHEALQTDAVDSLPQILDGRIVFVGSSAESIGDMGINPLSSKKVSGSTPNVFSHAYGANTYLKQNGIKALGFWGATIFSFAMLLILFVIFLTVPRVGIFLLLPLVFIGTYVTGFALFHGNTFLPIIQPLAAEALFAVVGIIINYFDDNREYRFITSMFKQYVSPKYLDEMIENHVFPKLGGEAVWGTAFFTDIEKFSTFSERFSPEDLIAILNTYFSKMTNILLENDGTLDKYSGDAIVSFFGAPRPFEEHAAMACKTAVEMQNAMVELRELWSQDDALRGHVDNIKTRIGINTGSFVAGNIGCEGQMNYTMIGDSVNLAARLESAGKQYGVYCLVGEETYNVCKEQFTFRELDKIVVVGKKEPTLIYELMGFAEKGKEKRVSSLLEVYASALEVYYSGDFVKAKSLFEKAGKLEENEGNSPSALMSKRCISLLEDSPENWDGVYSMTKK